MEIHHQYSLKNYNTFGIDVSAALFAEVSDEKELCEVLRRAGKPLFLLGGGSNVLLTGDLDRLVVHNAILGKKEIGIDGDEVLVEVGAGENWHDFVCWCLDKNYGGVENLSLIPGTAGAAPIQNIGAYGVELSRLFHHLEAIDLATGIARTFYTEDCRFGYRDSIFKNELKGRYCINRVVLRLTNRNHRLNLSYGAIRETLREMKVSRPTPRDVSRAVIQIRSAKLPDPETLGNSGSFFKNPEISRTAFDSLRKRFPEIVYYELESGLIKIPAGWLIEQCGWKGRRVGNVGSYAKQALVIVNYGGATGEEVWNFARQVGASVEDKFGIRLEPEVNVI